MKLPKYSVFLLILLLFSFIFRVYKIDSLSLFGDEIDVGYQAFSLSNTLKDYKGNFLPTYIQSLSESRAPLLIYLSIPGVKFFGLNELGVRITPIIFGILSIYLLYKLILLLSKSNTLALIGATAMSLSPWHFHYSRTSFEVTLLISLILAGLYFFFKFIDSTKNRFFYFSIILFGLTFYSYNTANIFTPLLVIFLLITNFKKILSNLNFKKIFFALILSLVIILPILTQIFSGRAANRFQMISIFNDPKIINQIVEKRTSFSASDQNIERIFHNKLINWKYEFIKNYIDSISPNFLFIQGDISNPRHNIPGFGLLFISSSFFLIIGLFSLDFKNYLNKLMLFWLLVSPIASSLTVLGGHHPTRLFLMLPPLSFFIGLGIFKLISSKKIFYKLIVLAFSFSLIVEGCLYTHEYFTHYPKDSFEYWNYGYKQIMSNIPQNSNNMFVSNSRYNSLLPFVFYQKYKNTIPLEDQNTKNIIYDFDGFKLDQNIFFINDWKNHDVISQVIKISQPNDTFILFQGKDIPGDWDLTKNPLPEFKTISTVYNPNHTILSQTIQRQ